MLPALSGAESAPDSFSVLLNNSPFGPARPNNAPAGATADVLEFRSVVAEQGRNLFSLHDPATRRSVWVALHEVEKGLSVEAYDAGRERLTVTYQGRTLTLPLKRAVVTAQAVPVPAGAAPVVASGKAGAAITDTGRTRAELVRQELQRRRTKAGLPPVQTQSAKAGG